jgi:hypothetical protein
MYVFLFNECFSPAVHIFNLVVNDEAWVVTTLSDLVKLYAILSAKTLLGGFMSHTSTK